MKPSPLRSASPNIRTTFSTVCSLPVRFATFSIACWNSEKSITPSRLRSRSLKRLVNLSNSAIESSIDSSDSSRVDCCISSSMPAVGLGAISTVC